MGKLYLLMTGLPAAFTVEVCCTRILFGDVGVNLYINRPRSPCNSSDMV